MTPIFKCYSCCNCCLALFDDWNTHSLWEKCALFSPIDTSRTEQKRTNLHFDKISFHVKYLSQCQLPHLPSPNTRFLPSIVRFFVVILDPPSQCGGSHHWVTVYRILNWWTSNIRSYNESGWLRMTWYKIKWLKVT